MSVLKIKIKCLPSWDANAGTPSMIRLTLQVLRTYWLAVYMLICFVCLFLETLKERIPELLSVLCSDKM